MLPPPDPGLAEPPSIVGEETADPAPISSATAADFAFALASERPALLRRLTLRHSLQRADAEDLAWDTIVRAIRRGSSYERSRTLGVWLAVVGHSVHADRRTEPVPVPQDDLARMVDAHLDASTDPAELLDRESLSPEVAEAMSTLGETQRQALWMSVVEGFTASEVAGFLGISKAAAEAHVRRAKVRFSRALRPGPVTHVVASLCSRLPWLDRALERLAGIPPWAVALHHHAVLAAGVFVH